MKYFTVEQIAKAVIILFVLASPCHAGPKRILTAIPRALGRTAVNMATFKNKPLAIQQWTVAAAVLADGISSHRTLAGCQNCIETSPFMHKRPSAGQYWLAMVPLAIGEATLVQGAAEVVKEDPNWFWHNSYAIDTAIFVAAHTYNTVSNVRLGTR